MKMDQKVMKPVDAIKVFETALSFEKCKLDKGELCRPNSKDLPIIQLGRSIAPFGVSDGTVTKKGETPVPPLPGTEKWSIDIQFDIPVNQLNLDFFNQVDDITIKTLEANRESVLNKLNFKNPGSVIPNYKNSARQQFDMTTGSVKLDPKTNKPYLKRLKIKLPFNKAKLPGFKLYKGTSEEEIDVATFLKEQLKRSFDIIPLIRFEGVYVINNKDLYPTWKLYGAQIFIRDGGIAASPSSFLKDETEEIPVVAEEEEEVGSIPEEHVVEEEEEDEAPPPPPATVKKTAKKVTKA
jgi:hypothetical protein